MSTPEKIHPENSPDESTRQSGGGIINKLVNKMEDRAGLYVSIVAIVIGSMALMGFFWASAEAQDAKREAQAAKNRADVCMLRTEGFTRALIAKGIDPYPHLKGEDP
jgi:hypothetical protein